MVCLLLRQAAQPRTPNGLSRFTALTQRGRNPSSLSPSSSSFNLSFSKSTPGSLKQSWSQSALWVKRNTTTVWIPGVLLYFLLLVFRVYCSLAACDVFTSVHHRASASLARRSLSPRLAFTQKNHGRKLPPAMFTPTPLH